PRSASWATTTRWCGSSPVRRPFGRWLTAAVLIWQTEPARHSARRFGRRFCLRGIFSRRGSAVCCRQTEYSYSPTRLYPPLSLNLRRGRMTSVLSMPVYAKPVIEGETFLPVPQMIRQTAATQPDKPAIYDGERCVRWGELGRQVNQIANALIAAGVRPGDMVAGLSENTAEYVALFLGVLSAGACMVPLSGMATGETLQLMIDDCGSRWLFVSARNRELAEPLRGKLKNVASERMIGLDFSDEGWQGFAEWLAGAPTSAPEVEITPDHPFNVIYSSGTTGTPKGIVHDHRMRSRQINRLCAAYGLNGDAITLVSTPLYSNTTLVSVLPTLVFGGTLVLMRKFDARHFLELAQR